MLVCGSFAQFCTRDRGCSAHPAFPAPAFEGEKDRQNPGDWAAGMRRCVLMNDPVIASEAKQSIMPRKERMDCFVASLLAMTAKAEQATTAPPSHGWCPGWR